MIFNVSFSYADNYFYLQLRKENIFYNHVRIPKYLKQSICHCLNMMLYPKSHVGFSGHLDYCYIQFRKENSAEMFVIIFVSIL